MKIISWSKISLVDGGYVASDLGDVKRLLHLPAGQRPTAHRAKDTIALLRRETPSFIGPELWPANSPDLNPVDYRIWGLIQERVYQTAIRDIDELKERLIVVWAELKQSVIDKAIEQWRPRLRACVQAKGHHFEHLIKWNIIFSYLTLDSHAFHDKLLPN